MAGEWSKKIGEKGERVAQRVMEIIGWNDIQKGLDIPCIENERHKRKNTHGLDGLFTYKSPLHDRSLSHICISVKYNNEGYPTKSKLVSSFKDHLLQLDNTINCFDDSEIKHQSNERWKNSGVDNSTNYGLLMWLHGNQSDNSNDDLISLIEDIRIPSTTELKHPIFVIDQLRANFLFESRNYISSKYHDHDITFNYHHTGLNNLSDENFSDGEILPVELINTGLLVYRATSNKLEIIALIIVSLEKFEESGFKRLLGFANHISTNLANIIEICYPNFEDLRHGNEMRAVKASFQNSKFTDRVEVSSYKMDVRNIE